MKSIENWEGSAVIESSHQISNVGFDIMEVDKCRVSFAFFTMLDIFFGVN